MSGGADTYDLSKIKDETGLVEEVTKLFNVNEETARKIIDWATLLARRKFERWQDNYIKRVMKRLDEKYKLVKTEV